MAKDASSQKFIGRNNAPRVQIEYDVEIYGSQKKVELPFVTGVMADLSGHRAKPLPPVEERKFLTFDQDNFDARMRAIKPRLKFYVDNTLSEENELLDVELEFESMEDFSPGAIARRIPQMEKLLEARAHLAELITYMDGKSSAEEVVKNLLEQPDFLQRLATDAQATVTQLGQAQDDQPSFEGEE
ncbi:type VI secretion system contractile sheath small subunit [Enterobacillus tribolii]|uniref:Type VI secretion system protein ImpB n=1 Tax=Enterobacillus tribolii TaxID=1487935 RepID=A0A370QEK7_9GAMM|nr:type VI secretion system contractile sheath small subunit [Enterobacillus tribolii]MBW7984136.1 type VI secretion system contractile sheath small subunit [Enterobacillus tribolii]RDK86802.1 type VI secretion system protein ImpB [Enterobacillus tribolii]